MKKYFIDAINNTGIARAFFTPKGCGTWSWEDPYAEEAYRELAKELGLTVYDLVRTKQTHTSSVKVVAAENGGEGVAKDFGAMGFDGMVTNTPGLLLCTVEADCVPVYILDPVHKAVGMVHSGWKGTAGQISASGVKLMQDSFGSKPQDLIVAIGPHICRDCYEVSEDLWEPFAKKFTPDLMLRIFKPGKAGKFYLNLQEAIFATLEELGVQRRNMHEADYCTYHEDICDSYRKNGGQPLRMLTAIMLNK